MQTITVRDNPGPTFTAPADLTIYTAANCSYDASVGVPADVTDEADNCSTGLQATFSDATVNGACAGEKIITRTWHLVDLCNNAAADQVQTITVRDNTGPTFTAPADLTIYTAANCSYDASVGVTGDVTDEADNCSTGLQATFSDATVNGTCAGEKIITRTWHLVDLCNNAAADQVQTITVRDNTGPTFTAPADLTIYTAANCSYDASVGVTGDVTDEADNCSTGLQATFSDATVNGACAGGEDHHADLASGGSVQQRGGGPGADDHGQGQHRPDLHGPGGPDNLYSRELQLRRERGCDRGCDR